MSRRRHNLARCRRGGCRDHDLDLVGAPLDPCHRVREGARLFFSPYPRAQSGVHRRPRFYLYLYLYLFLFLCRGLLQLQPG